MVGALVGTAMAATSVLVTVTRVAVFVGGSDVAVCVGGGVLVGI